MSWKAFFSANAPEVDEQKDKGNNQAPSHLSNFCQRIQEEKQTATVMKLEIMMTQTKEKVRSSLPLGGGTSMSGPGTMPWMMKAPNRIAMTTLAGTPNAMVVIKLPPSVELFAAPGPRTPRTSPLPKRSLSGELWTACA